MIKTLIRLLSIFLAVFLLLPAGIAAEEKTDNLFAAMNTVDVHIAAFDASVFARRLTMLILWVSGCDLCAGQIPALETISREYKGRMNVVGVLLDAVSGQGDSLEESALVSARKTLASKGATYPNIIATQALYQLMISTGVPVVPATWFVDTNGAILKQTEGARDAEGWRQIINSLLPEHSGFQGTETGTSGYHELSVGDVDPDVTRLKLRLYDLGYYAHRQESSLYTSATADIVRVFQRVNGLSETGIATRATQALLFSEKAFPKPK